MTSTDARSPDHDAGMRIAREIISETTTFAMTTKNAPSPSTDRTVFAEGDDGLYTLADDRRVGDVRADPRVAFAITHRDGVRRVTGTGRALILNRLSDDPETASALRRRAEQSGMALGDPAEVTVLRIIPETFVIAEGSSCVTVSNPYGGESKGAIALWWQAVRPFAYTASVTPMLLGAALAWFLPAGEATLWWLFPGVVLAGVLFHTGANLVSDYYDFTRGVDRAGTMGGSGILVNGLMAPREIFRGGMIAFGIGTLIGVAMLTIRGWPLLALGVVGFLGGFFYCGWPIEFKYRGLGEIGIFALFGPLMMIGSYYVLTGAFTWDVFTISLPIGFLVAAIVQANNLRDIADDKRSGITTASNAFGQSFAALEYYLMIFAAYVSVVVMIAFGVLPIWTLAVALSIPPAAKVVRLIRASHGRHTSELAFIDQMTAQVHLLFGLLLIVGIALDKLV